MIADRLMGLHQRGVAALLNGWSDPGNFWEEGEKVQEIIKKSYNSQSSNFFLCHVFQ